MVGAAIISECGQYRYRLSREWDPDRAKVVWVMLNPSTADASIDDPTIRRCIGFSKAWGYGGLVVVNLFAYRATDPKDLLAITPQVAEGPENTTHVARALCEAATQNGLVVAAWGAGWDELKRRWSRLGPLSRMNVERAGVAVHCLGKTKSGSPRHPLYVRSDQHLMEFR